MDPEQEHPAAQTPGICGITRHLGGVEWVCIRAPHDTQHQRSSQPSPLGYYPQSERHYFVNRWPNRAVAV